MKFPQIFLKLLVTPNSVTSNTLLSGLSPQRKGRKPRPVVVHTDSRFRYAALLRYCTDYAFGFSMLDETGFYAPSVAHNAFNSRPWLRISVLHGHNPTVSKQLRYALSRESVRTPPGGAYGPNQLKKPPQA